jgi:membrane associated rhomboid family serine protease/Flp pilus assembly protein TadD
MGKAKKSEEAGGSGSARPAGSQQFGVTPTAYSSLFIGGPKPVFAQNMATPVLGRLRGPAVSDSLQCEVQTVRAEVQELCPSTSLAAPHKGPSAITILIGINVLIFFAMMAHEDYVRGMQGWRERPVVENFFQSTTRTWGSNDGLLTLNGQFWRILTSNFVHQNSLHLIVNMAFLAWAGKALEKLVGRAKTIALYVLTGACCDLLTLSWNPAINGYGASGAVYGFAGVLIPLLAFAKLHVPWRSIISLLIAMTLMIPFGLLSGHPSKTVDYRGHLGGFLGGLLIGVFLVWAFRSTPEKTIFRQRQIMIFATGITPILLAILMAARTDARELHRCELALDRKAPGATEMIQRFVARNPNNATGHAFLGISYDIADEDETAAIEYERALKLDPDQPHIQYYLALLYTFSLNRPNDALPLYRQSLPYLDENWSQHEAFVRALLKSGHLQEHLKEAEKNARRAVALNPKSKACHSLLSQVLFRAEKFDESFRESALAEEVPPSQQK